MDGSTNDIITTTVAEFCRLSGLSRSTVYELISDGTIASIMQGRRRLIVLESWRRHVASQCEVS